MHIILDAMGSDDHPGPEVLGAVEAARKFQIDISLIGHEEILNEHLSKIEALPPTIHIVHPPQSG